MPYQLRDNIYWCDCAGRAVFLDVEKDRYFCLPSDANGAFLRLAAGLADPCDAERLQMLVSREILVEGGAVASIKPPPIIEMTDCDLLDEPRSSPGPLPILRELVSEAFAVRLLRTRSFSEVIDLTRRKGCNRRDPPLDEERMVQAIAAASSAASYLLRAHDRCLIRALAVHWICTGRGIRPKLVFGVIAHPFSAHCWVQLGHKVLVGGFEQARLYTPILVIE